MLTGKKLVLNGSEILGSEEIHPIVIECLSKSGVKLTQDLKEETISIECTPGEGLTLVMGENENAETIIVESADFEINFEKMIKTYIEAFHAELMKQQEAEREQAAATEAQLQEIEHKQAEQTQPGFLEQFSNNCSYYFNAAWSTLFGDKTAEEVNQKIDRLALDTAVAAEGAGEVLVKDTPKPSF